MSNQSWTIDSIAHALPHPELRQSFMREANFSPVGELPDLLAKWVRFIEKHEAERPRIEELRAYYQQHGQLPPAYEEESAEGRALYEQWKARQAGSAA